MKKANKPKTQNKDSHKETVARIAAANRAYFQKLESQEKLLSRKLSRKDSLALHVCPYCGRECSTASSLSDSDVCCPGCYTIFNPNRPHSNKQKPLPYVEVANSDAASGHCLSGTFSGSENPKSTITTETPRPPEPAPNETPRTQPPQEPTLKCPSLVNGSLEALLFFVIACLVCFLCWDFFYDGLKGNVKEIQPRVTIQPRSQTTTPTSVAGSDLRMEAKKTVIQEDVDININSTTPSKYSISNERAEKYLGSAAQEEMRIYLMLNGDANPSKSQIDAMLKINERFEFHQGN